MDPAIVVKLLVIGGIVLMVVAIGLRARPADALLLVRNPGLAVPAMFAMFVAVPGFVLFVTWALDLQPAVRAALLALSVAPMPPILANKQAKAGGSAEYAIGLQVLASVFAIAVIPVMLAVAERVFGVAASFDPLVIGKLLLITVGLPLAAGMLLGLWLPGQRDRLAALGSRIGTVLLGLGALAVLYVSWPAMAALIGGGILAVAGLITVFALAAGHLLGGSGVGHREALAIACASRHPGVAIALATGVFPDQRAAITGAVLLSLLAGTVLTLPYVRWRGRADLAVPVG